MLLALLGASSLMPGRFLMDVMERVRVDGL